MRKSFLILQVIVLFSLRGFSQAEIAVDCDNSWGPGRYNKVVISIEFGSQQGFARFTQDFPEGFEIITDNVREGDFSVAGTRINIVWMKIPAEKRTEFSYLVKPDNNMSGNFDLEGRLIIISGGQEKQIVTIKERPVSIAGSNGLMPADLKIKSRTSIASDSPGQIIFRVQASTSLSMYTEDKIRRDLALEPDEKITVVRAGKVYKYQVGEFPDYDSAFGLLKKLKDKGFSDAFIVAYSGKDQIPVDKARSR